MYGNGVDPRTLPIGVFDSGVGGLTVLQAIRQRLPDEDLLYLGDTARVPYGTKSALSVTRYAEQAAQALVERRVKALVIACNTASAVGIAPLRALHPQLLVEGVVEPGAQAACEQTDSGQIAVIATESTIQGGAYQQAIARRRPGTRVIGAACSLFVSLAEEGWVDGDLLDQVLARYLDPLVDPEHNGGLGRIDSLVLGCTHFPVLKSAIARVVGPHIRLVDSAQTTAGVVQHRLETMGLRHPQVGRRGESRFMVTDGPERFARVANIFLDGATEVGAIELVDIQHYRVPDPGLVRGG